MPEQHDHHEEHPEAQAAAAAPAEARRPQLEPQIYVASLSDYNDGRLHGVWLDASLPAEELEDGIAEMLRRSPLPGAEEWAIHDHDGFAGIRVGEYEDLGYVSLLAGLLQAHGPAFAAWVDICGDPSLLESFEQAYIGEFADLAAYGRHLVEELGYDTELERVVPPAIAPYVAIDEEKLARDLWLNGDIAYTQAAGGGVWIFDNHV